MNCLIIDDLDNRYIDIRCKRTRLTLDSVPIPDEVEREEAAILNLIMTHQTEHSECHPL